MKCKKFKEIDVIVCVYVCLSLNISTAAKKVDLSIENYYIGY
jgi:hypothetical protein